MMNPQNPPHIAAFLDHVPEINDRAFIAPTAAVVGAVRIDADSSIWYQVTVRGDNNFIIIGTGTNIQDNSCIHISRRELPTIIGNYVSIGHSALVHACTLEDHSFVGMGAIVLDGAVIESGAVVAAGALVPPGKTVPSGQLWAGSPAKLMRELHADAQAKFQKTATNYIEFGRAARLGLAGGPYNFTPVPLPPKD